MTSPGRSDTLSTMNPPNSPPRWVRELHEAEAVWTAYQRRRASRNLLSALPKELRGRADAEEVSEATDWLAAEREVCRVVQAHGHCSDERR